MTVGLNTVAPRRGTTPLVAAAWRRGFPRAIGFPSWRAATVAVLGFVAALVGVEARALGLGPASVSSGLGEPLRMSIPVSLQPDEEIGCVQVRPHGDDLPSVSNTRSQVLRSGGQTRIEIQSGGAVDEPAVGLVVSVGCASPVARDYVLFLDPPAVAPLAVTEATTPLAATAPRRAPPRTRPARPDAGPASASAASDVPAERPRAIVRPPRRRAPAVPAGDAASSPNASSPKAPSAAAGRARPTGGGDRLSVVPTEPPVIGRTARSPQPGVFPPPVTDSAALAAAMTARPSAPTTGSAPPSAAPATASTAPTAPTAPVPTAAPQTSAASATADTAIPATPPAADAEALAREEALRQQQVVLQSQIKNLSDQIAALRVQATSLAARNQTLESTAFAPTLVWLLIVLAVLAIAAAGWMAWRYQQLRRSLENSAWWTTHTEQDHADGSAAASIMAPPTQSIDPGSRAMARAATRAPIVVATPVEPRSPAPVAPASNAQSQVDRIRPPVRAPGSAYPAAMDTDFTVSDIEAAMATVRTVSPPRSGKAAETFEDSDFAGLGGALGSPFGETPSASGSPAVPATTDEESAHFMDLDIPPVQFPARATASTPAGASAPSKAVEPANSPFDVPLTFSTRTHAQSPAAPPAAAAVDSFGLDFPGFDPLATDSMKTTIVDRREPDEESDQAREESPDDEVGRPRPAGAPAALDFELPSQTQIIAMTTSDQTTATSKARHGATALNDLFAPLDGPAHDTVLDLADRDGTPLSATEVDRLTSPLGPVDAGRDHFADLSERGRLARFADLLTQVDDMAIADPLGAIATLRRYVLRDERIPTLLWLRLFELYKVVDKRPVHDALAEHFTRRYHRPMVGWTQTLADRTPQRPLSALVDIDRRIEAQWGTAAGVDYLETLLCDRSQDDAIVFNAVLQADLLDAAKVFPDPAAGQADDGPATASGGH